MKICSAITSLCKMNETQVVRPSSPLLSYSLVKWSIFGVLILSYILVYFHRMAPGVASEYLMGAFQATGTQLGVLSAIYFFVYAFMQIPSGVVADTLGTRVAVIAGNLVAGLGSILFGLSASFEMACAGRFLVGLGVSVVFVAIMKSNSVWFHERVFAFMGGLTLFIGNLGSVLAAGPLAMLLTIFSWRNIFIGIGGLAIMLAVFALLVIRNKPEDLGFDTPNNYDLGEENVSSSWMHNLKSVVSVARIWPGFWVQFGMVGSLYSFMGLWGVPYLRDVHGITNSFAAAHMTVMLLSFAVGALFLGWFSDQIGTRKPILTCCVVGYLACWLVLVCVPWIPGIIGYLLFGSMGLAGSGFVLTFAAAKEVIHPHLSGMAVSVVNMGCFIGTALMQPLFGYLADLSWDGKTVKGIRIYAEADYNNGFYLVLIFAVIAVLGTLRVRETHCRNISLDC